MGGTRVRQVHVRVVDHHLRRPRHPDARSRGGGQLHERRPYSVQLGQASSDGGMGRGEGALDVRRGGRRRDPAGRRRLQLGGAQVGL